MHLGTSSVMEPGVIGGFRSFSFTCQLYLHYISVFSAYYQFNTFVLVQSLLQNIQRDYPSSLRHVWST